MDEQPIKNVGFVAEMDRFPQEPWKLEVELWKQFLKAFHGDRSLAVNTLHHLMHHAFSLTEGRLYFNHDDVPLLASQLLPNKSGCFILFDEKGPTGCTRDFFELTCHDIESPPVAMSRFFTFLNTHALNNRNGAVLAQAICDYADNLQPSPMQLLDNPFARNWDAARFRQCFEPLVGAMLANDQPAIDTIRDRLRHEKNPAAHGNREGVAIAQRLLDKAEEREADRKGGLNI